MVVEDGYEFYNERVLVTVFSAPNVSIPTMRAEHKLMINSTAESSTTGELLWQSMQSCYACLLYTSPSPRD